MTNRSGRWFTYSALLATLALSTQVGYPQSITHQVSLPSGVSWCDDTMINGLLTKINAFRSLNAVPALTMDSLGMKKAEVKAVEFATYVAASHPSELKFSAASSGDPIVNENLAYTTDPSYVVDAVWQDPLHRAALLDNAADVAGVSCINANGTAYWTYKPGYSSLTLSQNSTAVSTLVDPASMAFRAYEPKSPGLISATLASASPASSSALDSEEWAFLTLINNYRAQNGAGPLQVSVALRNSSLWMSNDMATHNGSSHSDSFGRDPYTRLVSFNYPYFPWGENIAGGYGSAQSVFNAWVNSPEHQRNMVNPTFAVMGIGRTYNSASSYGWYWVTDFGGYVDQTISPTSGSAPTITSFTATPSTVTSGQLATLSWTVSGATTVSIDNGIGDVSNVTSKSVSPTQPTTYTLTATNSGGSVTARVTVNVSTTATVGQILIPANVTAAPGDSVGFQVTLAGAAPWGGVFITLTSSDPSRATITPTNIFIPQNATTAASAPKLSGISIGSAIITASASGLAPASQQVQIGSGPAPTPLPAITSFFATPSTITAGQPATLSWSVSGSNTVGIDNGVGNVSNVASTSVSPTQTTSYTLTATNSGGSVKAQTTVTVSTAIDTQPPTVPTIVSAIARSATEIDLVWTASTDNIGVARYQIIRNGSVVASVSGGSLSYADNSVSQDTAYTYFIKAYDAAGNYSSASNSAQVTTPALPLSGTCPTPATGAFTGCYYDNTSLTGNPVFIRTDSQINFDWGGGSPDKSLSPGNFSVRWQGNVTFAQGAYTFTVITSDGMRLYIDGNIVLDRWRDQPPYIYTVAQTLGQGNHLITVEYYERNFAATAVLSWRGN